MVIDINDFYGVPSSIERLYEELWNPLYINQRRLAYPPVNISEDDSKVLIQAELPGVRMEDVALTLTDSSLVIKGERLAAKGRYLRQERPVGRFQRVVHLSVPVDRDRVKAVMKDGLLEVALPKAEDIRPKKINIAVG